MSVYVDDMMAGFGRMKMSHLIADTTEELVAMAVTIGVNRKWIQKPGTGGEHYDIGKAKRELAIAAGAIPISWGELSRMVLGRRSCNHELVRQPKESQAHGREVRAAQASLDLEGAGE